MTQLSLNEQKKAKWKDDILNALNREGTFNMKMFNLILERDVSGKDFMEQVAYDSKAYIYLNSIGLVNRGFCPITGKDIDESLNYNIFGRYIFLSEEGLDICKAVQRKEHNTSNSKLSYDETEQLKRRGASNANRFTFIAVLFIVIFSFYLAFILINPAGFLSYIYFIVLGVVLYRVFMWFFNMFLIDIFVLISIKFKRFLTQKR